jgi:hypothetical protein
MAPAELERLSREELLELVRRQRGELAEREATIERRDEKIRPIAPNPRILLVPRSMFRMVPEPVSLGGPTRGPVRSPACPA